jgi:hypothetical protein
MTIREATRPRRLGTTRAAAVRPFALGYSPAGLTALGVEIPAPSVRVTARLCGRRTRHVTAGTSIPLGASASIGTDPGIEVFARTVGETARLGGLRAVRAATGRTLTLGVPPLIDAGAKRKVCTRPVGQTAGLCGWRAETVAADASLPLGIPSGINTRPRVEVLAGPVREAAGLRLRSALIRLTTKFDGNEGHRQRSDRCEKEKPWHSSKGRSMHGAPPLPLRGSLCLAARTRQRASEARLMPTVGVGDSRYERR